MKAWLTANFLIKLAILILVFGVLKIHPYGDLPAFYLPMADSVAHGKIPYRDFPTDYGPLFPVMVFLLTKIGGLPLYFLTLLGVDVIAMWAILKVLDSSKYLAAACIWIFNADVLWNELMQGQQQVIVGASVICIAIVAARKQLVAGYILLIGTVCSKFFIALFLPMIGLVKKQDIKGLLLFGLPMIVAYVILRLFGLDFLNTRVTSEMTQVSSGNITYLVAAFWPFKFDYIKASVIGNAGFLFFSTGLFIYLRRFPNLFDIPSAAMLAGLLFLGICPRAHAEYLIMILPLIVLCMVRRTDGKSLAVVAAALGLSFIGSTEEKVWNTLNFITGPVVRTTVGGWVLIIYDIIWVAALCAVGVFALKPAKTTAQEDS